MSEQDEKVIEIVGKSYRLKRVSETTGSQTWQNDDVALCLDSNGKWATRLLSNLDKANWAAGFMRALDEAGQEVHPDSRQAIDGYLRLNWELCEDGSIPDTVQRYDDPKTALIEHVKASEEAWGVLTHWMCFS